MTVASAGPSHPWRQYRNRLPRRQNRGPSQREIAVAELMAAEHDEVRTVQPGVPYRGPRNTAERIAAALDMKPANVRNVMAQIRKRMGADQAR